VSKKKKKTGPPAPNTVVQRALEERSFTTAGQESKGSMFVRDPRTGEVKEMPKEDASARVFQDNWELVDEKTGETIRTDELSRERSNAGEALVHGVAKGLTGGLVDLASDDPDAHAAIRGMEEGSPVASIGGEIAGTLAPFAGPMKSLKLGTVPGLADEAGQLLTRATAGEAPGFLRQAGARVLGLGVEGGAYGVTNELRRSHVDDTPLTAEKLAFGFMAGALPGAILGAPIAALEAGIPSLARRYSMKGELSRAEVIKPGVDDATARLISERDFGGSSPGMLDEFQAANVGNPLVSADTIAIAKDGGAVGQQFRKEIGPEGAILREESEETLAGAFDAMRDREEAMFTETGRYKRDHIRDVIGDDLVSGADVDDAVARAVDIGNPVRGTAADDIADSVAATLKGDAAATAELKNALGVDDPGLLKRVVKQGIEGQDPAVIAAVNRYLKKAPDALKKAAANDNLRPYAQGIASNDNAVPFERVTGLPANDGLPANSTKLRDTLDVPEGLLDDRVSANTNAVVRKVPGGRRVSGNDNSQEWSWKTESLRKIDSYAEDLARFTDHHRGYTGGKNKQLNDMLGLLATVRTKVANGKRVDAAIEMDFLKRKLAKYAKSGERLGVDDTMAGVARKWYDDVRLHLEDARYWGDDFAAMQGQTNALLHKRISRSGKFWDTFFSDAGVPDPRDPWRNLVQADRAKIKSAFNKYNAPEHDVEFQMLQTHLKEAREEIALMRKYYQSDRIGDAQLKAYEEAVDAAETAATRAKYFAMRQEQGKALAGGSLLGGGATRVMAGYVLGGPLGAIAGTALNSAMNPGAMIQARAKLERVLRSSEGRIAKGVTKILTGKGGKLKVPSVGATALASKAAVSLFSEKDPEKRAKAYGQTMSELADATVPGRMEAAMAGLEGIEHFVPNARAQAAMQYRRAAAAVLAKAPVRPYVGPFGDEETAYPSDQELQEFEDTYRGALDPIGILEAAAEHELSAEMVDAADLAAPELMSHIRQVILQVVNEEGSNVEYDAKVQLSVLFKMPLDQTMQPEYVNAMQTMHRARFQEGMGPRSRRTFDETGVNDGYEKSQMSNADRLEREETPR
jgi:hypothetical protein